MIDLHAQWYEMNLSTPQLVWPSPNPQYLIQNVTLFGGKGFKEVTELK